MDTISTKIQETFADYAICKDRAAYGLFAGRNLPTFVKDYILNRFSRARKETRTEYESIWRQRCHRTVIVL